MYFLSRLLGVSFLIEYLLPIKKKKKKVRSSINQSPTDIRTWAQPNKWISTQPDFKTNVFNPCSTQCQFFEFRIKARVRLRLLGQYSGLAGFAVRLRLDRFDQLHRFYFIFLRENIIQKLNKQLKNKTSPWQIKSILKQDSNKEGNQVTLPYKNQKTEENPKTSKLLKPVWELFFQNRKHLEILWQKTFSENLFWKQGIFG